MTRLSLIRHGDTAWNEARRLQGRTDIPLSPRGRARLAGCAVTTELRSARWISSPLRRAVETARLLAGTDAAIEPRLIEMDWGEWEGRTLAELRTDLGAEMAANEARGLDFTPTGGESPRQVQARLRPWLADVAAHGEATVAVTHKGVIRAILALAANWDMMGKPPVKLDWRAAHAFSLDGDGNPAIESVNLALGAARGSRE